MSEERKNLHLSGIGLLRPSNIGGEACEGCEHNQRGESCALVLGSGEALRSCAKLLFKDCELVPVGTKARIAELEADVNRVKAESDIAWRSESKMTVECVRLRKALKEIAKLADSEYGKRIPAPSCVEFLTIKQYAEKALEGVENVEKDS